MQLTTDFSVMSLNATAKGELIYFEFSGKTTFAIVLDKIAPEGAYLAIMQPADNLPPFHTRLEINPTVLSYGTNWVVEPIVGPESDARNRRLRDARGALHLMGTRYFVHLDRAPSTVMSSSADYDLSSKKFDAIVGDAVPFRQWRVWAKREDRSQLGGTPLFSIEAADPK